MSVPRTVAEVLKEHVTLEVEGIDRMYLNVYVPQLQREQGVATFFRFHRGHQFASSALMDPISKAFVKALEDFAKRENVPVVPFLKGQRKDDIAAAYRKKFNKPEGVVFIGKAQEKTRVFRTASPERANGCDLSLAGPVHGDGESVLRLLCGSRFRPVLSQVQQLLSLYSQAVHQWPRIR